MSKIEVDIRSFVEDTNSLFFNCCQASDIATLREFLELQKKTILPTTSIRKKTILNKIIFRMERFHRGQ